jgi:hypothetical protein
MNVQYDEIYGRACFGDSTDLAGSMVGKATRLFFPLLKIQSQNTGRNYRLEKRVALLIGQLLQSGNVDEQRSR